MNRRGKVFMHQIFAGIIEETDAGTYVFIYDPEYLRYQPSLPPISLTLPRRNEPYEAKILFPFFDGLIPEGWLLNLAIRKWNLEIRDRMGILLEACGDCIGAVHIEKLEDNHLDSP